MKASFPLTASVKGIPGITATIVKLVAKINKALPEDAPAKDRMKS